MNTLMICIIILTLLKMSYSFHPPYYLPLYTPPHEVVSTCGQICEGKFQCKSADKSFQLRCIASDQVCDGIMDCEDGSDEKNCRIEPDCMPSDRILCQDRKTCAKLCDGKIECPSLDDELNCPFRCPEKHYKCKGEDKCIHVNQFCDRKKDCLFGDDEKKCPIPENKYMCQGGTISVSVEMLCDGEQNCPQGDDESMCPCQKGEYLCYDGRTCLPRDKLCDDNIDCPGAGDDESICRSRCSCKNLFYEYFCRIFFICMEFTSMCEDDDFIAMLQERYCQNPELTTTRAAGQIPSVMINT